MLACNLFLCVFPFLLMLLGLCGQKEMKLRSILVFVDFSYFFTQKSERIQQVAHFPVKNMQKVLKVLAQIQNSLDFLDDGSHL